ncbi:hypothetical protein FACS189459_2720 [Bacilli bacterium]|nr:hypothetical protein FACS189459_2720 [Bacilli bacterium]GHU52266.1 hypothetical protein FACS189496_2130 [Bacilli bacterium]
MLILKYACSGSVNLTFLGIYKKLPPDHTEVFNAAYLLSQKGTNFPKYFFTISGAIEIAVSISQNITPSWPNLYFIL